MCGTMRPMRGTAPLGRLLTAAMALSMLSASWTTARAQETRTPPEEAVELFASARQLYLEGQYPQALAELQRALQLDPGSPTLLFNLARVSELMGNLDEAIAYAENYQQLLSPDDEEERESIQSTLNRLRGARDYMALRASAEAAPPELRQLAPRVIVKERGIADLPFWLTLGGGAGLLLAGTLTGAFALRLNSDLDDRRLRVGDDPTVFQADLNADSQRLDRLALSSDILIGLGAAATTAALLLYVLRVRTFERDAEPGVDIAVGPTGVMLRGQF